MWKSWLHILSSPRRMELWGSCHSLPHELCQPGAPSRLHTWSVTGTGPRDAGDTVSRTWCLPLRYTGPIEETDLQHPGLCPGKVAKVASRCCGHDSWWAVASEPGTGTGFLRPSSKTEEWLWQVVDLQVHDFSPDDCLYWFPFHNRANGLDFVRGRCSLSLTKGCRPLKNRGPSGEHSMEKRGMG